MQSVFFFCLHLLSRLGRDWLVQKCWTIGSNLCLPKSSIFLETGRISPQTGPHFHPSMYEPSPRWGPGQALPVPTGRLYAPARESMSWRGEVGNPNSPIGPRVPIGGRNFPAGRSQGTGRKESWPPLNWGLGYAPYSLTWTLMSQPGHGGSNRPPPVQGWGSPA